MSARTATTGLRCKVKIVRDREDNSKREREAPTTGEGAAKQAKTFTYPSLSPKPPETIWSPGGDEWHEPNYEGAANQWLQQQTPQWQQQLIRAHNQWTPEKPRHQNYTDDRGVEVAEEHFGLFAITIKIDPRHLMQTRSVQQVSDEREHVRVWTNTEQPTGKENASGDTSNKGPKHCNHGG
jgi:hypothetical protein